MKLVKGVIGFLAALLLTAAVATAQSYEESVEESTREITEMMEGMADFVKDVTFDEDDVKSMIKYRDELEALGEEVEGEGEGEGSEYDEEDDEMIDFKEFLANPEYRSWAKSRGLDSDTWMKKLMRFQMLMMKNEMAANASEGNAQMAAQLAELEAQRAQMGEEMYQQMKQAMEMGAATMSTIGSAYDKLPEPTSAEKALIERYKGQFMDY